MAWATARRQLVLDVEVSADATVGAVIEAARAVAADATVAWDSAAVGIFGEVCARTVVPRDGDRIELYRPLAIDPKAARRARARRPRGE